MDIFLNSLSEIASSAKMTGRVLGYTWFFTLPPIFYLFFKVLWMYHIQEAYAGMANWVLLEIIPPKNIEKSPKPMESVFVGFAGVEKSFTTYEQYIDGASTDYMSLEMVSDQGAVHFYFRTMKKYRHLIEANLYAQYPDVEIIEVSDYVDNLPKFIPNKQWSSWGADVATTKDHDAYPIRSYSTYEETVTGTMIDPLSGLIEVLGKAGPGEHIWIQWIITPTPPKWNNTVGKELSEKLKGKEKKKEKISEMIWKDLTDVLGNLAKSLSGPVEFATEKKKDELPLDTRLSPMERDVLKAVEANLGKVQFWTKGRIIYLAKRENYDVALGVSAIWGALKQFGDDNLNGFKPEAESKTSVHYDIFKKERLKYRQHKLFRRYKNRSRDGFKTVLSSEELASIFHLPDMNVIAPAMSRVEAKRGGAPSNLPIE
ncbi:MAG: hypothetical protein HGA61_03685 [Candidatus Moranbacteria bacterium]|nr:hypothetical protein [Candidatus Moranbacteria bacterium]